MEEMRLPVSGSSMLPMLKDHDVLVIGSVTDQRLVCGDLVVRGRYEMIAHRVLWTQDSRVYTKGDARYWIDPMTEGEDIWGIVKQIDRSGTVADMEAIRWKVINRLIGFVSRIQVYLVWTEQVTGQNRGRKIWWHRFSFWVSKKVNWVILFLLASRWLYKKPLRIDEK